MRKFAVVFLVSLIMVMIPMSIAHAQTDTSTPTPTRTPTRTITPTPTNPYTATPSPTTNLTSTSTPTPIPSNLRDGLVSCWEMDEISGIRYDRFGPNHLTDNNTVGSFGSGLSGRAAEFIRANEERLTIPYNYSLAYKSTPWTINLYFHITQYNPARSYIMHKGQEVNLSYLWSEGFRVAFGNNVYSDLRYFVIQPVVFRWYMLGGTFYPEPRITYWLDNNIQSDTNINYPMSAYGNSFNLGNNGGAGGYPSDIELDTTTVWNRGLSTSDIVWLYNDGFGRSCSDIINTGAQPVWPTATATPVDRANITTSNGLTAYLDRHLSYGDVAVSIGLGILILVILGSNILEVVHRWLP